MLLVMLLVFADDDEGRVEAGQIRLDGVTSDSVELTNGGLQVTAVVPLAHIDRYSTLALS